MSGTEADDRRNRFLEGNGNGNGTGAGNTGNTNAGSRAASQPPHHSGASPGPFLSPTASHPVPTAISGNGNGSNTSSGGGPWGHTAHGLLGSASHRSASFSAGPRFPSTFEDDELLDPDEEEDHNDMYGDRYHSPTLSNSLSSGNYRGRAVAGQDLNLRSRSQSLATTTMAIGTGRNGSGFGSAIGSAANSYSNAYLYGNNAYGHPYGAGGGGGLSGSLGGLGGTSLGGRYAGSPLIRSGSVSSAAGGGEDGTNMSPFMRDVGSILLDDGNFRELWERERGGRDFGGRGEGYGFPSGRDTHHPSSYSNFHSHRDAAVAHQFGADDSTVPGSGTTSRRHSVSVVQPRRLAGFHVPESPASSASPEVGRGNTPQGNLGLGLGFGSVARGGGGGGLLLSDDDLEVGLGGLSLGGGGGGGNQGQGYSALSPTATMGRRRDDSLSRAGGGEDRYDRGYDDPRGGRASGYDRYDDPRDRAPPPGSLPIHAPLGRSPSLGLSIGAGLGLAAAAAAAAESSRPGGGAGGAGGAGAGGVGAGGGASKDWADAYFSPPRESVLGAGGHGLNINTNVGGGAGAGAGRGGGGEYDYPQYEGGRRVPSQSGPLSPGAGVGRYGAGGGQYGQQQQPPYSPHAAQPFTSSQYGGGGGGPPSAHPTHPTHASSHVAHLAQGPHHPAHAHSHSGGGQVQGHGQGMQGHAQGGQAQGQGHGGQGQPPLADLGKGLPLHAVPPEWPLYIVEFKAGRTDLFYRAADRMASQNGRNGNGNAYGAAADDDPIRVGDLVIVEADRGKDLGKVVNDSITLGEVEAFWAGQQRFGSGQSPPTSPGGAEGGGGGGGKKEIAPKMIYGKAGAGDAQLLVAKMQDELKALALCQTKVRAKKLPMEVVDAEYQWDRRKLTFYFVAEKRIDFRELVRELFRLYKTRIWMASLQGAGGFEQ